MIEARYKDISENIKNGIRDGRWQDRLPGVFKLAKEFSADPATISKAVRLLEQQGLVTINGRRGTFITSTQERTKHKVIAVVGVSSDGTYQHPDLTDIQEVCLRHGYQALAISHNDQLLTSNPEVLSMLPVDGLIFMYSTLTKEVISSLRNSGMPFVSANKITDFTGLNWVDFDSESGLKDNLNYLYKLGHRRIAFVEIYTPQNNFTERMFKIYRDFCESKKIFYPELFLSPRKDGLIGDAQARLVNDFASSNLNATAVITLSPNIAEALRKLYEVPEKLSIILYSPEEDDFYTINKYHRHERAVTAAEMLLKRIDQRELPPEQVLLHNSLIPGKSTAPYNN
jgi:DNA-binding LacI/PurR family transcriptional regulator